MTQKRLAAFCGACGLLAGFGGGLAMRTTAAPSAGEYGNGRFIVSYSPQAMNETFLVDTASGQTWQIT